jgi:hypothetical protein
LCVFTSGVSSSKIEERSRCSDSKALKEPLKEPFEVHLKEVLEEPLENLPSSQKIVLQSSNIIAQKNAFENFPEVHKVLIFSLELSRRFELG